jgi:arginyl-tRNA synthetase
VKKNIQEEFKVSEEIADVIAVGAVKYSFLKVEAQKGISFDIKESISVQGNSGPYLQCSEKIQQVFKNISNSDLDIVKIRDKIITVDEANKELAKYGEFRL